MTLSHTQVAATLDVIATNISTAVKAFERAFYTTDSWEKGSAEWYLEVSYTQLMALTEALNLPLLRADVAASFARASEEGMLKSEDMPDGDPHPAWAGPARRYAEAITAVYATDAARTITRDVESILRSATYSITDPRVFGGPPQDEATLHRRLEALLRCLFPDLVSKPRLGKPIKNFEPDTGIPSLQTLIEYKYIHQDTQVAVVADEILADTRGYTSRDWSTFIYVIYETRRFRPEAEWRQLLRSCGIADSTTLVVLTGETPPQSPSGRTRRVAKRPDATAGRSRERIDGETP